MSRTPPPPRTPPTTLGATYKDALACLFGNLGTIILVVFAYAVVTASIDHTIYTTFGSPGEQPDQSTLIKVLLGWEAASLVTEILLGPLFAAAAVYIGREWLAQRSVSIYGAVNFGLNRYARIFLPHMAAQIQIRLGLLILVPGILYIMQFACVDSAAALETRTQWALDRSKKLTRGRRKRIFMLLLPVLLITQVMAFADLWAIGQGAWMLAILHVFQHLLMFTMALSFFLVYAERTTPRPQAAAPKADTAEADTAEA